MKVRGCEGEGEVTEDEDDDKNVREKREIERQIEGSNREHAVSLVTSIQFHARSLVFNERKKVVYVPYRVQGKGFSFCRTDPEILNFWSTRFMNAFFGRERWNGMERDGMGTGRDHAP